jgi:perosamine synthetase
MIPRGKIYLPVRHLASDFIRSCLGRINEAAIVKDFETQFAYTCHLPYCTAFPHARMGVYYLLKAWNLPPESEVLLTPLTTQYIIDAIKLCGHQPRFIDIDPEMLSVTPEAIDAHCNPRCRVLILTYLYGITPDVTAIINAAKTHDLYVIEDFSQHLWGSYQGRRLGTFGDAAVYSCSITKTLDLYGGGLTVTGNSEWHAQLQEFQRELLPPSRIKLAFSIFFTFLFRVLLSRPGMLAFHYALVPILRRVAPEVNEFLKGAFFDFKAVEPLPDSWQCAFSSVQAKRGLENLSFAAEQTKIRREHVEKIKRAYKGQRLRFPTSADLQGTYWQLLAITDTSALEWAESLRRKGMDTGAVLLPVCSDLSANSAWKISAPNAQELKFKGLIIPAYPGLSEKDLEEIIRALNAMA